MTMPNSTFMFKPKIAILGVGAIGSWLAYYLALDGFELHLVDRDRVEAANLGTSFFPQTDLGKFKTDSVQKSIIQKCRGTRVTVSHSDFVLSNADLHKVEGESYFVVDCLDNSKARNRTWEIGNQFLVHIGLSAHGGEVMWHSNDLRPFSREEDEANPVCTNQLGLGIISITVACAVNSILKYLETGQKEYVLITKGDSGISVRSFQS